VIIDNWWRNFMVNSKLVVEKKEKRVLLDWRENGKRRRRFHS
jgi:urease accessory protein UreE